MASCGLYRDGGVAPPGGIGWRAMTASKVECEELHRPAGAGVVLAVVHAGQWGAAVVGLDFADRGQHCPVQSGAVRWRP